MTSLRRLAFSVAVSMLLCARVSSAQAPLGAVVWDTFTGTNGTQLTAHAPDKKPAGAVWTHRQGATETLQENRVGIGSGTGYTVATIETGIATGTTGVDIVSSTSSIYGGVVFRVVDGNSHLLLAVSGSSSSAQLALYRRAGTSYTLVQSNLLSPVAANTVHRVEARYSGNIVEAVYDGVTYFSSTITDYQTATGSGVLWHSDSLVTQFDNFSVTGAPPGSVVWDTFAGANGTALGSHPPEKKPAGATWSYLGLGTSGVRTQGNRAELSSPGSGHQPWSIESGQSDVTVYADFKGSELRVGGLVLRATSNANYLVLGVDGSDLVLMKSVNGDRTVLTRAGGGFVTGQWYRIEARANGSQLTAFVNGVQKLTTTNTYQQTATRHGITFHTDDYEAQFDNFVVIGPNQAPVVSGPSNQFHLVNSVVSVPIAATDPEGQTLTYSATGLPPGLSVNASTGVISGTLTSATGGWPVTVTVSDGTLSTQRSFTWAVAFTNNAPIVSTISNQNYPVGSVISLQVQASDVEGQPLTYSATGLPPGLGINSTSGLISGTITPSAPGTYPVEVSVFDGISTTISAFIWTVTPALSWAVVWDTFTAANGTPLQSHPVDLKPLGAAWAYVGTGSSSARIQGNRTELALPGSGHQPWAIESGRSDVVVSADFIGGDLRVGGLIARAAPGANYLEASIDGFDLVLGRVQNGNRTILTRASPLFVTGQKYHIELRAIGTQISAYVDGAIALTTTSTFQQTATKHGVTFYFEDPAVTFDNFEVRVPGEFPTVTGPLSQTNVIGTTIAPVTVTATNPQNAALTFTASGLPAGLSLNTSTGAITGTLTAAVGTYTATLTVFDGVFAATRPLRWTLIPPPPSPPPLARVFDSFTSNGSIGPLTAHVPDVRPAGASWVLWEGGAPTVDAGGTSPTGGGTYVLATINGGTADGIVAVDLKSTDSGPRGGIALRVADAANYNVLRFNGEWSSGRVELLKRVNGEFKVVRSAGVGPMTAGSHRLEARLSGVSLTALWNGVSVFQMDVNDNQTSTVHGLFWNANEDPTATFDNFKITTEAFVPTLPPGTICEPVLSRWYIPLTHDTATPTVDVTMPAACTWFARILAGNASLTGSGGPITGSGTVQFWVNHNQGNEPMIAYASVAGRLVIIHQYGVGGEGCAYVATPDSLDFQTDGGAGSFTVTPVYPHCSWTAVGNRDWFSISDGSLRTGPGSITVIATKNTTASVRNGSIFVGFGELPVEQNTEACGFSVDRALENVSWATTSFDVNVYAPVNCGWEAVSLSTFIHITENPQGSGTLNFRVNVENNPQPYGRRGTVVVRKSGYDDWEITINQAGNPDAPDPGGEISYYHTDALGSVRMITDVNGGVVSRHNYLPFGQTFGSTSNPIGNRLYFTGKERDTETATTGWSPLDYSIARYYQSQSGRFTSVDPGHVGGNLVDPQSWNAYAYARNNPLRLVDPLGLEPCEITITDEAVASALDKPLGAKIVSECEFVKGKYPTESEFAKWAFREALKETWNQLTYSDPNEVKLGIFMPAGGPEGRLLGPVGDAAAKGLGRLDRFKALASGFSVGGKTFSINRHVINSLQKSGRRGIDPESMIRGLGTHPTPGTPGSLQFIDPKTGTRFFVNSTTNEVVGVQPAWFK